MRPRHVVLILPGLLALSSAALAAPSAPTPHRDATFGIVQVQAQVEIIAPRAPPPPRIEPVPAPPSTQVIWQQGHWAWNGNDYIWLPGRYVERPAPQTASWEPGHWEQGSNGWIWVEGHWQ